MKTSVSSSDVMIWTKVWETSSQKGKPWLSQNQSLTLIAIRSAKMTVREGKGKSQLSLSLLPWPAVPVKRWSHSFRSVWSPPAVLCPRL
uniref:Uncharacterized protein n=1 Tax=Peromyscus maniculatus bairdii TaxID=230844 RepID=A0A8C8UI09_PERMB